MRAAELFAVRMAIRSVGQQDELLVEVGRPGTCLDDNTRTRDPRATRSLLRHAFQTRVSAGFRTSLIPCYTP